MSRLFNGQNVSKISGETVVATVSVSSGLGVVQESGLGVVVNSGVGVTVNSGVGITIQSGFQTVPVGNSGFPFAQVTSGTLTNTASGQVHGAMIVAPAISQPVAITVQSGQPSALRVDANAHLMVRVASGDTNARIFGHSGSIIRQAVIISSGGIASGFFGAVAAGTAMFEGLVTTRTSGQVSNLRVDAQGRLVITQESGATDIIQGMSGIPLWQDNSGVLGVIVLSGIPSQVSGAVVVSGIVGISGRVSILSGFVAIQSGDIRAYVSGDIVTAVLNDGAGNNIDTMAQDSDPQGQTRRGLITRTYLYGRDIHSTSGWNRLSVTTSGSNSIAIATSGYNHVESVSTVSGIVGVSGSVSIHSGLIGILSGSIGARVSGAVQVSGTVAVSGSVFVRGMSGVPIWQDDSGVVGVTIISSNISVSTSVNSGLFVVIGSGNYMSGMGVQVAGGVRISGAVQISGLVGVHSGLVGILSGSVGAQVSGAVRVSGSVFAQGQSGVPFWTDDSGVVGVIILSGSIGVSVPITSGSVIVSGNVGILGQSGHAIPQTLSGWAWSGAVFGHIGIAMTELGTTAQRASGMIGLLSMSESGVLRVANVGGGAIRVSGTVSVSGLVGIESGLIAILSGSIGARVSGTIAVSGEVFAKGQSGIPFATDASGTIGVRLKTFNDYVSTHEMSTTAGIAAGNDGIATIALLAARDPSQSQARVLYTFTENASGTISSGFTQSLKVATAMYEEATITRSSGQESNIRVDEIGRLIIQSGVIVASGLNIAGAVGARVSGAVIVSGIVGISGSVSIHSGLVAILSGVVQVAGNSGFIVPQAYQIASGSIESGAIGMLGVAPTIYVGGLIQEHVSGQITPLHVNKRGGLLLAVGDRGRSRKGLPVTNASGGDVLDSGDCSAVTIRYHTIRSSGGAGASGFVYVGFASGTGERPVAVSGFPTSSFGIVLTPGDGITLEVENFNLIRVAATLSGDVVTYGGVNKA